MGGSFFCTSKQLEKIRNKTLIPAGSAFDKLGMHAERAGSGVIPFIERNAAIRSRCQQTRSGTEDPGASLTTTNERSKTMYIYYLYHSAHDGLNYLLREYLDPYLMTSDYLLFDTAEDCRNYWEKKGVKIDRWSV